MPNDNREFVVLDGLRGIAALIIVIGHAIYFFPAVPPERYLAVDFFFVLSGFVLAHAYGARLREGMAPCRFMLIRLIRLYPLYILAFALWLPIGIRGLSSGTLSPIVLATMCLTAVLFLPSPLPGTLYPWNFPAWSLLFEIIANAWLGTFGAKFGDIALGTLIAIAAIFLTADIIAGGELGGGWMWSSFWMGLLRVCYSFPAGVLVYRIWRKYKPPIRLPAFLVGLALLAVLTAQPSARYERAFAVIASLAVFPVLIWLGASSRPRSFIAATCKWLGAISYAIYVLHVPLLILMLHAAGKFGFGITRWPWGIAYMGVVILAADLANRVDKPARRYLTSLVARPATEHRTDSSRPSGSTPIASAPAVRLSASNKE